MVTRVVVFAVFVIVFGQILPRAIARRWPAFLAPVLLPVLGGFEFISRPHAAFGRLIARRGRSAEPENPADDRDAIQDLLREGELEGIGERDEIAIISGVVEFSEKEVSKIMRPRSDIFAIDEDTPPHDLAIRIAAAGYSRVPVYRGAARDNIIGMVHAFDVLKSYGAAMPRIRPVAFAAPTDACNELLFRMLRSRLHLAIIRDADQKLLGLVTLEDLLETLVGDIRDEHDEPAPAVVPRPR
jgi:putative hemolysin